MCMMFLTQETVSFVFMSCELFFSVLSLALNVLLLKSHKAVTGHE